ncbi:helicase associated domain-containing protein [Streptomyces sp. NPDC096152]|uniref:helicase associated domain-containing protein n=1 Tax=Streptomyces sp. NPDC096152 TaxID=3366078 RepID=UPI00381DB91A
MAELDALRMIWDKHDAAWRARLAAAADYLRSHGHLAAPAATPEGAWLAEQRHLAAKNTLDQARANALTALDPTWRLPHGADWHRKHHLLRGPPRRPRRPHPRHPARRAAPRHATPLAARRGGSGGGA